MGWRKKIVGVAKGGVTTFVEVAVPGGKIATKGLEKLPRGKKLIEGLEEEKKLPDEERLDNLSTVVATLVGVCEEQQDEIGRLKQSLDIPKAEAKDRVIEGVPFVYQADSRWADKHIVPSWTDSNGKEHVRTFQTYGCLLACICSIANHWRVPGVTPVGLAAYLREHGGFLANGGHQTAIAMWDVVTAFLERHIGRDVTWASMPVIPIGDEAEGRATVLSHFNALLGEGIPCILRMRYDASQRHPARTNHFVVGVGWQIKPDGRETLLFHDPATWEGDAYSETGKNTLENTRRGLIYHPVGVEHWEIA